MLFGVLIGFLMLALGILFAFLSGEANQLLGAMLFGFGALCMSLGLGLNSIYKKLK